MTRARWTSIGILLLAGIAVAALALRVPSIAAPLGIDQGLWASAVRAMARGERLYRDVWEQRPPGIYFIYLWGFRLFGWSAATVAWLDILAAAATTGLLAVIALRLAGRVAAALAAALFAALTMPAWLFGYGGLLERSVCETFLVVCVSIMAWCGLGLRDRVSPWRAVLFGVFAGATVVLKPNAGLYAPFLAGWVLMERRTRGTSERWLDPRLAGWMIAGAALLPVLTLVWLWQQGALADARVAVIDFNRAYIAQGFSPDAFAVGFAKAIWLRGKSDPLWLAGGMGSLFVVWDLARRRPLDPLVRLALWWGVATALVIGVNGARLYTTYFIQAYPPLALLAAWTILQVAERPTARQGLAAVTVALMLYLVVHRGFVPKVLDSAGADWAALRSDSNRAAYLERFGGYANSRGYSARANAELAEFIRQHTQPDDRVYLFGINAADVYFLADRLPAHRFLRVNFYVNGPLTEPPFRLDAVVNDLRQRRPAYIIFERLNSTAAWAMVIDALRDESDIKSLLSGYRLETTIEDFTVYRRAD